MNVSAEYRIVVLRRIFLKLAEKFCRKRGYAAIASGDNIGQVASQTLANISAIKGATSLLWIRPLECFNKQEIIDISQKIGTYDFSIEEYADCCGFLLSKHPSTAADENLIKELEVLVSNAILDDAFNNSFLVE
jgi:thiamine biosynthesis protein ThiI